MVASSENGMQWRRALAVVSVLLLFAVAIAVFAFDGLASMEDRGAAHAPKDDSVHPSAVAEPAEPSASHPTTEPIDRDEARVAAGWLLAVRVVDGFGEPVDAATIEVTNASGAPLLHGRTNAGGEWTERLQVDACLVRAEHLDVGRSIVWPVHASAAVGPVVLCLLQAASVKGFLLGPDGKPIVGASVSVRAQWALGESEPGPLCPPAVTTDARGAFAFEAVSGAYLTLRHALGERSCVVSCMALEGAHLLLAHRGAFAITVDVFDEHGQPIAKFPGDGAESERAVSMQLPDAFSASAGWNWTQIEAEMAARNRFPRLHTVFDEPGEYVVRVVAEGFAPRQVKAVLHAEEPRHVTSVVLPKGIATRGIVVKEDGRPCVGRRVHAEELASGLWVDAITANDGSFELLLPPDGIWQLFVMDSYVFSEKVEGPTCRPGETGLRIVDKEVRSALRDAPQRRGPTGVLDLEVLRSDGRPAPFPVLQWRGLGRHGREARNVEARVDEHRYGIDIAQMPGSPARLSIEDAISRETAWLDLPQQPGARTVRTQPRLPFTVRVVRDSVPMRGVLVELLPCGESMKERVDAEGVARFTDVPPGPMKVRVVRGFEELGIGEFELRAEGPHEFALELAR